MATSKQSNNLKDKEDANTQKTKYFQTATDSQTAPKLNNATIYRAKRIRETDPDNTIIANSYYTPLKLQSNEQPTFVDALKHRIDSTGKLITRSQVLNKKPKPKPISHTPISNTNTNIQSTSNTHNKPEPIEIESDNHNSDDSDSSSDDFDMNNFDTLTVPKVEKHSENNSDIHMKNEADDIRQKFKQRLELQKQNESQNAPIIVKNIHIDTDDNNSDVSESEYETVTDSDDENDMEHINPRKRKIQFFNKHRREQHLEQTNKLSLDEETALVEEFETDRHSQLKQQTHEDVLNYIREQEKLEREGDDSDEELPDDNDDMDGDSAQSEFEAWKIREMKRCLRDENMKNERERERNELEMRRKMTDEEIKRDNERLGLNKEKKKGQMKFMQKYYHQGVFYRDNSVVEEKVLDRNFNAPTGQDKYINFEKVPEAMRKKNFGKMSQSKWTHLANEDTTFDKEDREWFKKKNGGDEVTEEERERVKKGRHMFRHKAYGNNFWFQRAGTGALERPSHKKGNVSNWNNKRFERKEDKGYDKRDRRDRRGKRDRRDKDRKRRSDK